MHENKFEKQVQKKMDELQLAPSEAVWKNVDKEINKQKKRRRPVFWLFFFFGLLLLGGGYFFEMSRKPVNTTATNQQPNEKEIAKPQDIQPIAKNEKVVAGNSKINSHLKKSSENISTPDKRIQKINAQEANADVKTKAQVSKYKKDILSNQQIAASTKFKPIKERLSADEKSDLTKETSKLAEQNEAAEKSNEIVTDDNKETRKMPAPISVTRNAIDTFSNKKTEIIAEHKVSKSDSVPDTMLATAQKSHKQASVWEVGITAGGGISNIEESLFKPGNITSYNTASSSSGGFTFTNTTSEVKSHFSFDAGFFLRKPISKRLSFSAAFHYHFYSTEIFIGQHVDSVFIVYSPSTPPNGSNPLPVTALTQVNSYYKSGSNKYINQYHFFELPVSLGIQLNRSRKLPLIWEGGFSFSYLLHSNALLFDAVSGVYYKSSDLLNKVQLNGATAIMLGARINKSMLEFGPQLQYGLTDFQSKNTGNPGHLFYGGLKVSFIPRKK
jgi:outer membrane protein with beta-barrel domain